MQWLPPLLDNERGRLPLADRSAIVWLSILAESSPSPIARGSSGAERLTAALADDPAWVVWAVAARCQADAETHRQPRACTLAALGAWLAEQSGRLLSPSQRVSAPAEPAAAEFAKLSQQALAVATRARELATAEGQPADEAQLLGLTHAARRWLTLAGLIDDEISALWPVTLTSNDLVRQAIDDVGRNATSPRGKRSRAPAVSPLEETLPGARELWSKLPARWARANELEENFAQTLEAAKLEALAEFAAGAGHEINNPIAVVAGRAQLFLRHETDPERRRELAVMNAQAMRVYEMIADMMLFARPPEPRLETCALPALLAKLVAELAPKAQDRGTKLLLAPVAETLAAQADRCSCSWPCGRFATTRSRRWGRGAKCGWRLGRSRCCARITTARRSRSPSRTMGPASRQRCASTCSTLSTPGAGPAAA